MVCAAGIFAGVDGCFVGLDANANITWQLGSRMKETRGLAADASGAPIWVGSVSAGLNLNDTGLERIDFWGNDSCAKSGDCATAQADFCNDNNACTADGCAGEGCALDPLTNTINCKSTKCASTALKDGSPCAIGKTCLSGVCK